MTTRLDRRQFLAGLGAGALLSCSQQSKADVILTHGEVLTCDLALGRAEALAIAGDRIVAVGSAHDLDAWRGPQTLVLELDGRTVIPGINDSHLHAMGWGLSRPPFTLDVGYPTVESIADVVQAVAQRARELEPGTWITGRGWDEPYFAEGRSPTRFDLDPVSPDHPVMLTEFSGHAVWVNSAALAAAGITADTEPPPGGVIVRDASGRPSGVLFESATGLIFRAMPETTDELREQAILAAAESMLELGITSFTDPGVDVATARVYERLAREGRLPTRASILLRSGGTLGSVQPLLEVEPEDGTVDPHRFRIAGVKIMGDGIPTGNKTAWLHEPYEGGGNGKLVMQRDTDTERVEELHAMIDAIHRAGLQIGVHATGDRAIDAVVDGYAKALDAQPRRDARHYVIHADLASPRTLERMSTLGIGANFNPGIKFMIADGQRAALGAERASYEWPYRTALDQGVVVASSSDAPVTDGDWRQGVATCILRRGKQSGEVSGPEQCITLEEALRTYTWAGAWQDFAENAKGSIEVGKLADLCILDERLGSVPPEAIPKVGVAATVVGGRLSKEL